MYYLPLDRSIGLWIISEFMKIDWKGFFFQRFDRRDQGLRDTEYRCLLSIGSIQMKSNDDAHALRCFEQALLVARHDNNKFHEADALDMLGKVLISSYFRFKSNDMMSVPKSTPSWSLKINGCIDRMHKWRPKKYSFVYVLIRLTSLVCMDKIQKKCFLRGRLVSLISA